MKKIFLILLTLFVALTTYSQAPPRYVKDDVFGKQFQRLIALKALEVPWGVTPTLNGAVDLPGHLYYSTVSGLNVYDGTTWLPVASGGAVTLYTGDGTITGDRTVTIPTPQFLDFIADNEGESMRTHHRYFEWYVESINHTTDNQYKLNVDNATGISFLYNNPTSGDGSSFSMNSGGLTYTDNTINKTGITYQSDYSGTYTDRTLVDKGYVDGHAFALVNGNGTIANGSAVDLGGDIIQDADFNTLLGSHIKINGQKIDFDDNFNTFLSGGEGSTGTFNVFVGENAGNNAGGDNNTFIGTYAGDGNTQSLITAVGSNAGHDNTGTSATFIGAVSGNENTYNQVIIIGNDAHAERDGQLSFGDYITSIRLFGMSCAGCVPTDVAGDGIYTPQLPGAGTVSSSATLSKNHVWIGDASNIAQEKLITGDVVFGGTGVTEIQSGVINNSMINSSAAIAWSKMAALTASRLMQTDASGFATIASGTGFIKSTAGVISYDNSAYSLTSHTHAYGSLTGIPTTVSGYGITDAVTLTGSQTLTNKTLTAPVINSPTGITKTDVGLANVDNTSDVNKPVSTATQTALNLKANLASPTFTGTVAGITSSMVGLGNVDNTSDVNKPVSTAQQTALNLKANLASPTFTGTVTLPAGQSVNGVTLTAAGSSSNFLNAAGTYTAAGTGTVSTVSVVSANGVSGSVATATTTPAITLSLGAITPTSVAASGTVTGSNISGTNTGDQNLTNYVDKTAANTYTAGMRQTFQGDATNAGFRLGGVTASPSSLFGGDFWYNSATGNVQYYDGVAATSRTFVTLLQTQTLTNKTLTAPVINSPTGIVKGDVGLGNVDNTSDVNKPVSTAQAAADALKANLASPTFTGTVTLPAGQSVNGVTLTAAGSSSNFLNAAGTYTAAPGGSGITALTGNVTASGTGSVVATIASNVITNSMINTSAAIDYSKLANYSAYIRKANNTSGAAAPADLVYKSFQGLTYAGTATWTSGTTNPSGTPVIRYSWTQDNKDVDVTFTVYYPTSGTSVTGLTLTLPSDMPNPYEPTGTGAADDILYPGTGFITTNYATDPSVTARVSLKVNTGDTGYEFRITSTSVSARYATLTVHYVAQ